MWNCALQMSGIIMRVWQFYLKIWSTLKFNGHSNKNDKIGGCRHSARCKRRTPPTISSHKLFADKNLANAQEDSEILLTFPLNVDGWNNGPFLLLPHLTRATVGIRFVSWLFSPPYFSSLVNALINLVMLSLLYDEYFFSVMFMVLEWPLFWLHFFFGCVNVTFLI